MTGKQSIIIAIGLLLIFLNVKMGPGRARLVYAP